MHFACAAAGSLRPCRQPVPVASDFSLEHALTCRRGDNIAMRHNEVFDLFTALLRETCHNVATEPELQPLNGTPLHIRGANLTDGTRLDIKAGGFWRRTRFEAAFFDVMVFNPYAASSRLSPPQRIFDMHDRQKHRLYEERIREVEGASFTPLVFSNTSATGRTSEAFLKRLASLLSDKRNTSYSETMGWLRCRVSFALLRANVLVSVEQEPRLVQWRHTFQPSPCPRPGCSASQWAGNKRPINDISKLIINYVTNFLNHFIL